MKLNKELCERLRKGEIQLKHTGTVEQLRCVLRNAFPKDIGRIKGTGTYYMKSKNSNYFESTYISWGLPIYNTDQFFEAQDQIPEVGKTLNHETRELAKQLLVAFVEAGDLPSYLCQEKAIQLAKEFVEMLDKEG